MPAVWPIALALGRSSRRTIAGSSAAKVGWVTASPQASRPTSAMIATGWLDEGERDADGGLGQTRR